jgi:hypothetical protein
MADLVLLAFVRIDRMPKVPATGVLATAVPCSKVTTSSLGQ